uniref:Uncharacterized protein n=1 Tax=Cacopsylla melanoneura TaxID=428564 RepID=A0A8D9BU34_9HEMI
MSQDSVGLEHGVRSYITEVEDCRTKMSSMWVLGKMDTTLLMDTSKIQLKILMGTTKIIMEIPMDTSGIRGPTDNGLVLQQEKLFIWKTTRGNITNKVENNGTTIQKMES